MKKLLRGITLLLTILNLQVYSQNQSEYISQDLPETINPGEEFTFTIVFKNTGNTVWEYENFYNLGSQFPQDNYNWGTNRINLPNDVAPNEEVTITSTLTAPEEEGVYGFQWKMVQDGVEWFGEASKQLIIAVGTQTQADSLLTSGTPFSVDDHIVSTSFFQWFTTDGGQQLSPWVPIDGRASWTGEVPFWKTMIKEVMAANIDVLYVELIPFMEIQRVNLFLALNELRREGWDVPKVCPFLDPEITYAILGYNGNAGTEAGKDELVGHYIRFYQQYFTVNTDAFADDYIYTQDQSPVLDIWHIQLHIDNYWQLNREDITSRLSAEFGAEHPIFNHDIKMINNAYSPAFSFADERVYQFEMQQYKIDKTWNGITTSLLKPGYWDQNVRNPGYFLPRSGGVHFRDSWDLVNQEDDINRVYIESFNEYDEGSGIYAARTDTIYKKTDGGMNNTNNDVWSDDDDPFEYIKTNAAGAAIFNERAALDAQIIWHNIPESLHKGEYFTATVIVRNQGNESWSNATGIQFGEQETADPVMFSVGYFPINDQEDDIPIYGGIFRGRTKSFQVEIIAPDSIGNFETHWSMLKNEDQWFGNTITQTIQVLNPSEVSQQAKTSLNVFPNPTTHLLHISGIKAGMSEIKILNVAGKCIHKEHIAPQTNYTIDIQNLSHGVYFIKIGNEVKMFIKK